MSLLDRWRQRVRAHHEHHIGYVCPHCGKDVSQADLIADIGGPVVFVVGFVTVSILVVAVLGVVASLVFWLLD